MKDHDGSAGFLKSGLLTLAIACVLALVLAVPQGRAADPAAEPWIFVVVGDEDRDDAYLDCNNTDLDNHCQLNYAKAFEILTGDQTEDFAAWIAARQRDYESGQCHGKPFPALEATATIAEDYFQKAFAWYLGPGGFSEEDFEDRAHGPRVELTSTLGMFMRAKKTGGNANYLFCKNSGYMEVDTNNTSHIIQVGPKTADLIGERRPVFYLSAAHELGHVAQGNALPVDVSMPDWVGEATADAMGMFATQAHYGKDYFGPYSSDRFRRFFLSRPYHLPLNFKPDASDAYSPDAEAALAAARATDSKALTQIDYKTNGFWYSVVERYLNKQPGGLNALYKRFSTKDAASNATATVDDFLDSVDGPSMTGLAHVYPQFLTEYAVWWDHRFDGKMTRPKWEEIGFDGCEQAVLSRAHPAETLKLELAEYAGGCFRVLLEPDVAALDPDLQIKTHAADNGADEVYLGLASTQGLDDTARNVDCYEIVEKKLSPRPAPCLLDPRQGISGSRLSRLFSVLELGGKGAELVFVATRVPQDMHDLDSGDFPYRRINVELSLDFAASATANDDGSSSSERAASTDYASKVGSSRVDPEGDKEPGEASPAELYTGRVRSIPGAVPDSMRSLTETVMATSINVVVAGTNSGEESSINFQFIDQQKIIPVLEPGDTKTIQVLPMSSGPGFDMSLPDPDQESHITIREYSDETLRFEGVAHVCEGNMRDMTQAGMSGLIKDQPHPCEVFKRRTYRASGAIAFPTVRNGIADLKPHDTEAFLAYRDLRIDTIQRMRGASGPPQNGGAPAAGGSTGSTGSGGAAPADESCDCACEARTEQPRLKCKLLCGKKWKMCPAE